MKKISKITIVFVTIFVMFVAYFIIREPKMHYDVVIHVKDGSARWYRNMDYIINFYTDKMKTMKKDDPEYKKLERTVLLMNEELALQKKLDAMQKDSAEYNEIEQKLKSVRDMLKKQ